MVNNPTAEPLQERQLQIELPRLRAVSAAPLSQSWCGGLGPPTCSSSNLHDHRPPSWRIQDRQIMCPPMLQKTPASLPYAELRHREGARYHTQNLGDPEFSQGGQAELQTLCILSWLSCDPKAATLQVGEMNEETQLLKCRPPLEVASLLPPIGGTLGYGQEAGAEQRGLHVR